MMDKDYLYQIDIREWIERGLDADIMVPVSGNKIDKKYDIYLQSFLLPLNEVENDMENDTYNAHTLIADIQAIDSSKYSCDQIALLFARQLIKRLKSE